MTATCVIAVAAWLGRGVPLQERLWRLAFIGRPLLVLSTPALDQTLSDGALELFVGFPDEGRVATETFRCLLNGRDVTRTLTVGRNGAHGRLFGLTEGENSVRVEVFGRSPWTGRYVQDFQWLAVSVRGHPELDRAGLGAAGAA
jgi:hypothetical protein